MQQDSRSDPLYHKVWDSLFPRKWVLGLFLVFSMVKRKSGSILGAILTHAGFNFTMGFLLFYAL
jgi:hypothetical protein